MIILIESMDSNQYYVKKRNNTNQPFDFNKINARISNLINKSPKINDINIDTLSIGSSHNLFSKTNTVVSSSELDKEVARIAVDNSLYNPNYADLAARIVVSDHHKNIGITSLFAVNPESSSDSCYINNVSLNTKNLKPDYIKFFNENIKELSKIINYERDYAFTYNSYKLFLDKYSMRHINDASKAIETPQDMFIRVAISLWMDQKIYDTKYVSFDSYTPNQYKNKHNILYTYDTAHVLKNIKETYDALSLHYYTHATPTYFNIGTIRENLASCFLISVHDTREHILSAIKNSGIISSYAGGLGMNWTNVRGNGVEIKSSGNNSDGIVPFLRIMKETVKAFNQGGRRPGSCAIYLMPHHLDFVDFLNLRKNEDNGGERIRELFYAVWISDEFMTRLKNNQYWYMIESNKLNTTYGTEYSTEYNRLVNAIISVDPETKSNTNEYTVLKKIVVNDEIIHYKRIKTIELWKTIISLNFTTGLPYICFADNANKCNMQNNIGNINCSNLCTEIYLHTSPTEYAVCNLASVNLKACVKTNESGQLYYDYDLLKHATKIATKALNRVIDICKYTAKETEYSNLMHRPIGIGIQGLSDVYQMLNIPFESKEASVLNKNISEIMYYSALQASADISREKYLIVKRHQNNDISCTADGIISNPTLATDHFAYPSYKINGGSHISHGKFHWELYEDTTGTKLDKVLSHDSWETLRSYVKKFGVSNSVLIAHMPTVTTASFLSNSESFEPRASNLYYRKNNSGNEIRLNRVLYNLLKTNNLWNDSLVVNLIKDQGSLRNITDVNSWLYNTFKTAYEIDLNSQVKQSIERQPFVDQGESLNLFTKVNDTSKLSQALIYAWKNGLKTGKYYLRSQPEKTDSMSLEANISNINISITSKLSGNVDIDDNTCFGCTA